MTVFDTKLFRMLFKFTFFPIEQEVLVKCQSYRPQIRSEAGMNERVTLIFFVCGN